MSTPKVAVVDYGVGNLLSVRRGLESCGADVLVTSDPAEILQSPRVLLPGVGAFANGMSELTSRGLDAVLREVASAGTPLLGICLGMQMLLDTSEEFGATTGLGLIPGRVVPIPSVTTDGQPQKIPLIGWRELSVAQGRAGWSGTPLEQLQPGEAVYFVHSFMSDPADSSHRVADALYGGVPVSATICRDNVYGCQFHPEKSGRIGLKVLDWFLHT